MAYTKPKVLKKADRFTSDKGNVLDVSIVEYEFEGKKYPKLQISNFKMDQDGFPLARPKSVNLPLDLIGELSRALSFLA